MVKNDLKGVYMSRITEKGDDSLKFITKTFSMTKQAYNMLCTISAYETRTKSGMLVYLIKQHYSKMLKEQSEL
jgi:hypothetical protein